MPALSKSMLATVVATALLLTSQAHAHCARCAQIEAERAREQAAHPQPFRYYDDPGPSEISLNTSEESASSKQEPAQSGSLSRPASFSSSDSLKTSSSSLSKGASQAHAAQERAAVRDQTDKEGELFMQEEIYQDRSLSVDPSVLKASPLSPHASSTQSYSTITTILQTKKFLSTLKGPFTLFIPSNEALRHLGPGFFQDLARPENQNQLSALVGSHLLASKILKKDFDKKIETINGRTLNLRTDEKGLTVNGARVLRTEPIGEEGIVYILDRALIP